MDMLKWVITSINSFLVRLEIFSCGLMNLAQGQKSKAVVLRRDEERDQFGVICKRSYRI